MVAGRVRQLVVLYSNDGTGICLGGLSVGRLTEVVVSISLNESFLTAIWLPHGHPWNIIKGTAPLTQC